MFSGVRQMATTALQFYFRHIEVVGEDNVPQDGAVLFCGNHQNSLIDPMMIVCFSGRVVRFAAADILFSNPILGFFFRQLQAVPIRRRQDHGGETVDNSAAFDALHGVLRDGGAMGIFPEGISHRDSDLSTFKTGPARLALGAKVAHPDKKVYIVPCGLYYSSPNRFHSAALLQFGSPIEMTDARVAAHGVDEREAVRDLTDAVEEAVRALTVTAGDWETIHTLDAVRRLYQPDGIALADRVELARRFNRTFPQIKDEPDVAALLERMRRYMDMLKDLRLKDRELRRFADQKSRRIAAVKLGVSTAVLTPLAVLAAPVHVPLFLFIGWGGRRFSPRYDVIGTTKVVAGMLLTLMAYAAVGAGVFLWQGVEPAVWTVLGLPVLGAALVSWLHRVRSIFRLSRLAAARVVVGPGLFGRLASERAELREEVDAAISLHVPADMDRLFEPVSERTEDG